MTHVTAKAGTAPEQQHGADEPRRGGGHEANRGGWHEALRDTLIIVGFGAFCYGVMAQYGVPVASMTGGAVLMAIGIVSAWRA